MTRFTLRLLLTLLLLSQLSLAGDTLRLATYNLLNYPGEDAAVRNPHFRSVMAYMNPDVLVVQEIQSQSGVTQFRDQVLNAATPNLYSSVVFNDGPDTDNALFYKSSIVTFVRASYIETTVRDIAEYIVKRKNSQEELRLYSVHLKAGMPDSMQRLSEAQILRTRLNNLPGGAKFIVMGDFNIYRSTEPAFTKLTGSELNNNGRCFDPLKLVGNWNGNFALRRFHTQSPRRRSFGGGTAGGMDDRFDLILHSASMDEHYVSTTAIGNDGNHFNDSINRLPNTAVPNDVANGLHYGSDHLPVLGVYNFAPPVMSDISMTVKGEWNLISLPVTMSSARKSDLFPGSTSDAYLYGSSGYRPEDFLENGWGYWLKFSVEETITLTGEERTRDTIDVFEGWNLIGSISRPLSVESIETIPEGLISSGAFGYGGSYARVDSVLPGRGYWIKIGGAGKIVLR